MDPIGKLIKPPAYVVGQRQEWFVSEEPESEGFAILARTDISNAEQRWLQAQHDAILEYQNTGEWAQTPVELRDIANSPYRRECALIAPYVLDWNARGVVDATGEVADIPPPSAAGVDAFDMIFPPQRDFITRVILNGYLYLGKAIDLRRRSPGIGDPSEEEPTPPETRTPRKSSRRKT